MHPNDRQLRIVVCAGSAHEKIRQLANVFLVEQTQTDTGRRPWSRSQTMTTDEGS